MTRPPIAPTGRFLLLGLLAAIAGPASAQVPRSFVLPRDKATWDARREGLRRDVTRALEAGLPARPSDPRLEIRSREPRPGLTVERFAIDSGGIEGILVEPEGSSPSRKAPLILLVVGPTRPASDAIEGSGWDGRPSAVAMARFGFASAAIDCGPGRLTHLRGLRVALDALLARPDLDADRIGVVGLGPGGPVALALMAVDERVDCGVSAVEFRDFADLETLFGPGSSPRFGSFDPATFVDLLASLCAPRPLALYYGERLPLPFPSNGRRLEGSVRRAYRLYGPEGTGLASTLFGEFDGHDSVATRLQWMGGLEQLDKHFRPQGPTPIGHEPEPEPTLDPTALNLSEHGVAGWAVEMSHRPGCWTWADGVISCKPGPNEYGWLRAPIEVGDFLLKVEWKVPEKGNAGIFLRARPVSWSVPPGDQSKPRVAMLGLDWPSRTGLELQAQDDAGHADRYSSGSLYRHAAPEANPTHPPGQWNRYTVRARGLRVEVWSNGRQVLDTTLDRASDTLPDPPLRGYIGLQNHGAPVEYRNVRLQKLGP